MSWFLLARTILPVFTSFAHAVELVQQYQLNYTHEHAQNNEARAEESLAVG